MDLDLPGVAKEYNNYLYRTANFLLIGTVCMVYTCMPSNKKKKIVASLHDHQGS